MPRIKHLLWVLLVFYAALSSRAAVVAGKVLDKNGEPLPFTVVFIKNTDKVTSTNTDGHYHLVLPVGEHEITFKLIGYRLTTRKVVISEGDKEIPLNVSLEEEQFHLQEIVVKKSKRDPAFDIIENAKGKRAYYLHNEIESFSCKAYIKGLAKLGKAEIKNKLMGIKLFDAPKLPQNKIVYFSESISEVNYQQPNKFKEKMIHSKVSGQAKGYSFASAYTMLSEVNFYHNSISMGELYERPFVSPIASNAFSHYDYELIETFSEYGYKIHKIWVTPLHKIGPYFRGYIYIVDGLWRIHSVNFTIDKSTGIDFIDTLNLQQTYAPQADSVWALINEKYNLKFSFNVQVASANGSGYIVGVFSDYKIKPVKKTVPAIAKAATMPQAVPTTKAEKKQQKKQEKKITRDSVVKFDNVLLEVLPEANKLDTSVWNEIRPLELTSEEIRDYHEKDSVEKVKNSRVYMDSVDRRNNKFKAADLIFGYTYRNSYKKQRFSFKPVFNDLQFNTMEGWVINPSFEFRKRFEDHRYIEISPNLRYGFSNTHFNARLEAEYYYKPLRWASIKVEGGRFVSDFNANEAITPFVNSLYTLIQRLNYLKMYEKTYFAISHKREIANGVFLNTGLEYAHRTPLQNTTDYSFHTNKGIIYTPNDPAVPTVPQFKTNNAFIIRAAVKFTFGQKYWLYPYTKITQGTKYPTLSIQYKKGIPSLLGSNVNFDFASVKVERENMNLKKFGEASISAETGGFINNNTVTYADYRHFNGNRTIFTRTGIKSTFWLLDYYTYSTNQYFVEAHWEHHLNGYLTDRLPLVRKLGWQLVNSANYLYTPALSHYVEASIGLEHVFKYFRVDYAVGWQQNPSAVRHGIRIGMGF